MVPLEPFPTPWLIVLARPHTILRNKLQLWEFIFSSVNHSKHSTNQVHNFTSDEFKRRGNHVLCDVHWMCWWVLMAYKRRSFFSRATPSGDTQSKPHFLCKMPVGSLTKIWRSRMTPSLPILLSWQGRIITFHSSETASGCPTSQSLTHLLGPGSLMASALVDCRTSSGWTR